MEKTVLPGTFKKRLTKINLMFEAYCITMSINIYLLIFFTASQDGEWSSVARAFLECIIPLNLFRAFGRITHIN